MIEYTTFALYYVWVIQEFLSADLAQIQYTRDDEGSYSCFKNSLIIHKEINQSHQRIGSRTYTFKTGNTLSV